MLPAGGTPITSYRLEMCCLGAVEGGRGDGGKGKAKLDPPFELAYLGPQRAAGARQPVAVVVAVAEGGWLNFCWGKDRLQCCMTATRLAKF